MKPLNSTAAFMAPAGGAGDRLNLEPGLLQQSVEHAPGERSVRPAALKGEVDEDRLTRGFPRAESAFRHDYQAPEGKNPLHAAAYASRPASLYYNDASTGPLGRNPASERGASFRGRISQVEPVPQA